MLRAVCICPDPELTARLEEVMTRVGRIAMVKSVDKYLRDYELERFLRAHAPQVAFVSFEEVEPALETASQIERILPGLQVVAIDKTCDSAALLDIMRAGIREFLSYPFETATFQASLARLQEVIAKRPVQHDWTDMVFTFLPAKAGVGASTLALNSSVALAKLSQAPVLLGDFDLNSGLIGFMLKLDASYTIYEACENALKLDEHLWPQLVSGVGKLHVLPCGRLDPQSRIEPSQVRQLLAFARRLYRTICLDLSGNMEKFSLEIMHESKRIFLVTTQEIPALHLARQKLNLLQSLDLADRVTVLLNRAQKRSLIPASQIEQLLGAPIQMAFPNDYRGVHTALTEGKEVTVDSELGRQFAAFAEQLLSRTAPQAVSGKKRKFLDFFHVLPARLTAPSGSK
jgi:pilus assembly protein CpaE